MSTWLDRTGIFVRRLDLKGGPSVVSMEGVEPKWSADGTDILFRVNEPAFDTLRSDPRYQAIFREFWPNSKP